VKLFRTLTAAAFVAAAAIGPASAIDLSGAGATFPYPIYAKWADAYKKETNVGLNYQSIGSGGGIKQIKAKTVTFGASDAPLPGKELDEGALIQFPMVMGGIVPVVNLDGVKPGDIALDGPTLAKIFMGDIKTWNDPAIVKLNPGVALPDTRISPIYRSDSSGTTDNFQKYLTAAAPKSWTRGTGSEFQGGVGEGTQKSTGVIQAVQSTSGAIGYVEKGFADQSGVPYAQINDGSGAVALTDDAARKAIDNATFAGAGNDLRLNLKSLYSTKAPGAYPLVLATYEIVCSKGYDPATTDAVKSLLTVAAEDAQSGLSAAGYVPLPDKFKHRLVAAINSIR